jgi:ABC-2 type transport system ATP-binding protein
MPIIEAKGLARTFKSRKRTVEAVRGVDLTVKDGEIVGFLGPNGAGKTTTLRMLTTLLTPTAGTATVGGADLLRDPVGVRRRIGYVPQAIGQTMGGTDPACLIGEELLDQAALYHIAKPEARGALSSSPRSSTWPAWTSGWSRPCPAASDGGWRSPWAWCTSRRSSSSTSPPPGLTRRAGRTCGTTSGACAPTWAPRSS